MRFASRIWRSYRPIFFFFSLFYYNFVFYTLNLGFPLREDVTLFYGFYMFMLQLYTPWPSSTFDRVKPVTVLGM